MRLPLALAAAGLLASAALATADPAIRVEWQGTGARIALAGDYAGARYEVLRAGAADSAFTPVLGATDVLCTGDCFAFDPGALPGATYRYRFDLTDASGQRLSYGPYTVTIGAPVRGFALQALAAPFRGRGVLRVSAGESGASRASGLAAQVALFDARGAKVRTLFVGPLTQLTFDLAWDGRDDSGALAPPGVYLARLTAGAHSGTTRVVLTR